MEYSNLRIAGIGKYEPAKLKEEKLTQSEMGAIAAKEAIADANIDMFEIDLIINVSISFERKIPDNGPLLQKALGDEVVGIQAITLQSGINSVITALDVASRLIASGRYRCILMFCSDITTQMVNCLDGDTFGLYGDGAAAVVLLGDKTDSNNIGKVANLIETEYVDVLSCGYGMKMLSEKKVTPEEISYKFQVENYQSVCKEMLKKVVKEVFAGEVPGGIGIIQTAVKVNLLPTYKKMKIYNTIDDYGICGTSSILMKLYDLIHSGNINEDDRLLLASVGDGLTASAILIRYKCAPRA